MDVKDRLEKYDLPDAALLDKDEARYRVLVWRPREIVVVIGRSNRIEESVHAAAVQEDRVRVLQRPTGGEAVVLSPRTVAISAVLRGGDFPAPTVLFEGFNQRIQRALEGLGVRNLCRKGISDLCLGERKILGCSQYRNRSLAFYHAVLNVAEAPAMMERYLPFPRRTPEYRGNRSHSDFVTSLWEAGYPLSWEDLSEVLERELADPPNV